MKRWIRAISGALAVGVVLTLCGFGGRYAELSENVVRLHIVANSDSDADQELKLAVRDAVQRAGAGLLDGAATREEAERRLRTQLPYVESVAAACVAERGYAYPVRAELTEMMFDTRVYDGGTFPAGRYHTVRVTIGEGKGRNWWCVMYPPLCVSAALDKSTLQEAVSNGTYQMVDEAPRFAIRFKVWEWLCRLWE